MYNVLQSQIKQMKEKGYSQVDAEKIATKHLQNKGYVSAGTMRMSDQGKLHSQLTQSERSLLRIAKQYGRPSSNFRLNAKGRRVLNPLFK